MTQTNKHFSENLRTICGLYPSISHISRKLGINRQQLNKYLNGTTVPSVTTLHKLSNFFAIDETEFFFPPREFSLILSSRNGYVLPNKMEMCLSQIFGTPETAESNRRELKRFCGKYFLYSAATTAPKITKSLLTIFQDSESTFARTFETSAWVESNRRTSPLIKVDSVVSLQYDRLFFLDVGEKDQHVTSFSFMAFYANLHASVDVLLGINLSTRDRLKRQISSSTAVLEYLGSSPVDKLDLRAVGRFDPEHEAVSPNVREMMGQTMSGENMSSAIRL